MSTPATHMVKGWCPGALRPMQTGDGLVVRVRPHGARLTQVQALGLADLAALHGSGLIDLGSRANLQLRGVRQGELSAVHQGLADLGLLDPDPATEARRNILTTPLWHGPETLDLVAQLEAALGDAPDLPPKFGFAVDTGARAILGDASADIRIERAASGLILRADGMVLGRRVDADQAVRQAISLAHWFDAHRGAHRRMAQLIAAGTCPPDINDEPPLRGPALNPGATEVGLCVALPFGQMAAGVLRALAVSGLRLTPWRAVVIEGVGAPEVPGLIADPTDPLLRVAACTGAPGCAAATVQTRDLARALAPLVPHGRMLHVSGCAKGCAHPAPADVTVTGRDGQFDLILSGPAGGQPQTRALTKAQLTAFLRGHFAP